MSRDIVHSVSDIKYLAEKNDMPLHKMRFFIGEDYREPRAFGVYQDMQTQEWVVYKNKDTGQRVERYRGYDEEFAAQEIWEKMEQEMALRIDKYNSPVVRKKGLTPDVMLGEVPEKKTRKSEGFYITLFVIFMLIIVMSVSKGMKRRHNGYYHRDNQTYYFQDGDWYLFDDFYDDWEPYYGVEDDSDWFDNYYYGNSYDFGNDDFYFDRSPYYDSGIDWSDWGSDSDSDSDSGWSWDSDSDWGGWDSYDTDWGSDW